MLKRWTLLVLPLTVFGQPARQLSLRKAEELALENHPALASAKALERAALETPKQIRARNQPLVTGAISAMGTNDENARIFAGGISAPSLYDHFGAGLGVSQLITDFGRTRNLAAGAGLTAQAQSETTNSTRAQILLRVDQVYFAALRAQAVLKVAEQTVQERQLVSNQTATLAQNKLRSEIDVTFANVNLSEAKLLLSNARNESSASQAELAEALGNPPTEEYELNEEPLPAALPREASPLIDAALKNRPEALRARFETRAAERFTEAERALTYPTVSAAGTIGVAPARPDRFTADWAAAVLNVDVPIFNGGLFSSRRRQAAAQLEAAHERERELANRIARDVRVAYLAAVNAFERLQLTAQLLSQAEQSLRLAQARYELGLGAIVELSQAQLNVTRAQIAQASARFEYQAQRRVLDYQMGDLK